MEDRQTEMEGKQREGSASSGGGGRKQSTVDVINKTITQNTG